MCVLRSKAGPTFRFTILIRSKNYARNLLKLIYSYIFDLHYSFQFCIFSHFRQINGRRFLMHISLLCRNTTFRISKRSNFRKVKYLFNTSSHIEFCFNYSFYLNVRSNVNKVFSWYNSLLDCQLAYICTNDLL